MPKIVWTIDAKIDGTSLRGYFKSPWGFEETVARLYAVTDQKPGLNTDEYKCSVTFLGTFDGQPFDLYDYKEGESIHIGGHGELNVDALSEELERLLRAATPRGYTAKYHYETKRTHRWGEDPLTKTLRSKFNRKAA